MGVDPKKKKLAWNIYTYIFGMRNIAEESSRVNGSQRFPYSQKHESMVGNLVPLKGGLGSIFHPPRFGKDYKWYISGIFPANWGIKNATDPTF